MLLQSLVSTALLAVGLLVDNVSADSKLPMHARAQYKYARASVERRSTPQVSDAKSFRFLDGKTAPYRVESLPDVNFDIGEMYSGLIPIDQNNASRALFFVFQPTIGAPVDEITIWLNGGPGCSSLEAFLQENGRFIWQPGTFAPIENPYTWVNLTNMLWVDQPVGTGMSIGTPTATTQEETAQDFIKFFKNFEVLFGIKKFSIYVTGESYAGRYVPYISSAMIDQNDREYFDLKGALTYDPVIGAFDYVQEQVTMYPMVAQNNNMFNLNSTELAAVEKIHKDCGYETFIEKYLTFPASGVQPPVFWNYSSSSPDAECDAFDTAFSFALNHNPCFNIYEINEVCPIPWDVLGFPTELVITTPGSPVYFDRPEVKAALHAPNITWAECGETTVYVGGNAGPESEGDLSADPIQHVLPKVIEYTNRVLVANGDYDMIIQTNGTLLAIQNMTWNGKLGFEQRPSTPISITMPDLLYTQEFNANGYNGADGPQGEMGVQHYERGLMWAETFMSGHMQPQYQPRVSYRHLEWLLGRVNAL